jgi:hypothetical protein
MEQIGFQVQQEFITPLQVQLNAVLSAIAATIGPEQAVTTVIPMHIVVQAALLVVEAHRNVHQLHHIVLSV